MPSDFLRWDARGLKIVGEDRTMAFADSKAAKAVPTNVVLPVLDKEKLRYLSRRTRIPQAAFIREAIADLLCKYGKEFESSEFEALIQRLTNREGSAEATLLDGGVADENNGAD